MYSKFSLSLEGIPRQKSFGCLSLKFGCIFSGLVIILYTVLAVAQCLASFDELVPADFQPSSWESIFIYSFAVTVIICHCVTLILTTVMLVGVLRDKADLMKPWVVWTSFVVMANILLMVLWSAIMVLSNVFDGPSLLMYMLDVLVLVIRIYMLTLVFSYFMQLVEEKAERMKTLLTTNTWHNA